MRQQKNEILTLEQRQWTPNYTEWNYAEWTQSYVEWTPNYAEWTPELL